jgi:hypothetical protein
MVRVTVILAQPDTHCGAVCHHTHSWRSIPCVMSASSGTVCHCGLAVAKYSIVHLPSLAPGRRGCGGGGHMARHRVDTDADTDLALMKATAGWSAACFHGLGGTKHLRHAWACT